MGWQSGAERGQRQTHQNTSKDFEKFRFFIRNSSPLHRYLLNTCNKVMVTEDKGGLRRIYVGLGLLRGVVLTAFGNASDHTHSLKSACSRRPFAAMLLDIPEIFLQYQRSPYEGCAGLDLRSDAVAVVT